MGVFKIIKINNNIGVSSTTLNSVAAKHDCRIEYDTKILNIHSHCDANAKARIIREVMGIMDAI